ncbi:MAG: transketolase [Alphaproteobacteria bacterium]|nr:transketolase [Alphaproteobacteria bacterium]
MNNLTDIATQIRRDIVRMVHGASSGHPGGSLGCTDFLTVLYFKIMTLQLPFSMSGLNEDVFFLSNGHISPLFYAVLARRGYFDIDELKTFRKINSRLQGHPTTHEHLPGIRVASGSLGQGLSVAIGAALAKKYNQDHCFVYTLVGDGELQEGQNWEAILFAAHNKVDNLILTVDFNGQQIDGSTKQVLHLGNIGEKFSAFGWQVFTMDGHNLEDIENTILNAKESHGNGLPKVIIMTTSMGKGVPFMEGSHEWHGIAPNDQQLAHALQVLGETNLGDY